MFVERMNYFLKKKEQKLIGKKNVSQVYLEELSWEKGEGSNILQIANSISNVDAQLQLIDELKEFTNDLDMLEKTDSMREEVSEDEKMAVGSACTCGSCCSQDVSEPVREAPDFSDIKINAIKE